QIQNPRANARRWRTLALRIWGLFVIWILILGILEPVPQIPNHKSQSSNNLQIQNPRANARRCRTLVLRIWDPLVNWILILGILDWAGLTSSWNWSRECRSRSTATSTT